MLYLMHRDADCDALGAAFALSTHLPGTLGVNGGLKTSALDLVESLGVIIERFPQVNAFGHVILVDTPNEELVGGRLPAEYSIIDHHVGGGVRFTHFENTLVPKALFAFVEPLEATCALVWDLLLAVDFPISRPAGLALLAGILTDTVWLSIAPPAALRRVGDIMEHTGLTLEDVYAAIDGESRSAVRRKATLKAIQSAREFDAGGLAIIAAITNNHDNGFAVSVALVRLGADIRIVAFEKNGEAMVMVETDMVHADRMRLDVHQILVRLSKMIGGGHHWGTRIFGRLIAPIPVDRLLAETINVVCVAIETEQPKFKTSRC